MTSDCRRTGLFHENHENNLQPFFVLHRPTKTARKTDVSQGQARLLSDDDHLHTLRIDAFNFVWSKINTIIKDVIKDININIFNDVNSWVHDSFKAIRSRGVSGFVKATRSYPMATDASSKLFAGLVYTKSMEFVDDQLTFEELGVHLKLHGCHVAKLSPVDFSAKNGIGGCLTLLLRQFLKVMLDAADMSILASWYCGQREYKPVVIIIEDMERCSGSILSDFILMLSEWVVKIPIVLVMGVTTTLNAPRNVLSSNALQLLCSSKFILESPARRMDAIVEAVLLKPCSWFTIGHKVALFMRDYFLNHDGTLTSFIRALKIACMQHFSTEPLSFLLKDLDAADDFQIWGENHVFKWGMLLKHSSQLQSCRRIGDITSGNLANALAELRRHYKCWATVVMCLYEAEKSQNNQLLDLFCEALDPDPHRSRIYHDQGLSSQRYGCFSGGHEGSSKSVSILRAARKVRDLQPAALSELLKSWETLADENSEIGKKVKELQAMVKFVDGKSSGYDSTDVSLRHSSRGVSVENEKALTLIEWMLRDYMKPIDGLPLHEIFCFKKVDRLQTALLGDPRKAIQADLLEFYKYLCCSCCSNRENILLPSLHDTSIMYILAQEHGDVINVHDWYQSFKATVTRPSTKARSMSKHCSSLKKRKASEHSHSCGEAAIQARFCRAVSELQITGLLRMPSKRRPDYVQRVAFRL